LLRIIDDETPDQEKLDAVKAMFYAVNKVEIADAERILNYQLFQISKRLSSGQLLLLKVVYESYKAGEFPTPSNRLLVTGWAEKIAVRLGHKLSYLVLKDEPALVEQGLIEPRIDADLWIMTRDARITDLGIHFCKNIESYYIEVSDAAGHASTL